MSLEVSLLKTPYEISFTGNAMPFMFALSPYNSTERAQDIRLSVRIEIEDQFGSNVFIERKNEVYFPDATGQVYFDIASIVAAYLEYYTPRPGTLIPLQALYQRKRYRISYLLQKENVPVGATAASDILYAIKGGMSYDNFYPQLFIEQHVFNNKKPLHYFTEDEKTGVDELRFLWWLYPLNDSAEQSVTYTVYFDDGTSGAFQQPVALGAGKWAVCCIAIGFNQCGLNALVPAGKYAVYYTIEVNAVGPVVAPVRFDIDHRKFYETKQLLFRNSLGGVDTLRLRGQTDFEADYERQMAVRTIAPNSYKNLNLEGQQVNYQTEETAKFKGDTGFCSKPYIDKLRDLFMTTNLYEFSNNKLLPIAISGKNTKFYSLNDSLTSIQIEWQHAFVSNYYTPANLLNTNIACPAMEKFIVKQKNKSTLQIMWSIPQPYDRIEISIDNAVDPVQIIKYSGNTGSLFQTFINPADPGPVNITVRGRVLCDEFADPINAGPYTDIVISVTGDSLPVANDDVFTLPAGFTTPQLLTGSVLTNDYDPDGDAIAVVVNAGATHAGGAYSIDAAGAVTFTPLSSSYNGSDYFDYELSQFGVGTGIIARCYINVGSAPSGVFAKIVMRNINTTGGSESMYQTGEVWIDFFGDPAGTIPLDITTYGLNINFKEETSYNDSTGTGTGYVNKTEPGTSNKIMIYDGLISSFTPPPVMGDPDYYFNKNFTVLTGTGYSPI